MADAVHQAPDMPVMGSLTSVDYGRPMALLADRKAFIRSAEAEAESSTRRG